MGSFYLAKKLEGKPRQLCRPCNHPSNGHSASQPFVWYLSNHHRIGYACDFLSASKGEGGGKRGIPALTFLRCNRFHDM